MSSPTGLSEDVIAGLLQLAVRMAARWCASPADAQDVAQDALIRLLRQNQPPDNAATWLFVVTRRLSHRRTLRDRSRLEAETAFATARGSPDLRIDLLMQTESVLARLTPQQRTLLRYVAEGWLTRDIADVLGCAPGNIGTMVARARTRARQVSSGGPAEKRRR